MTDSDNDWAQDGCLVKQQPHIVTPEKETKNNDNDEWDTDCIPNRRRQQTTTDSCMIKQHSHVMKTEQEKPKFGRTISDGPKKKIEFQKDGCMIKQQPHIVIPEQEKPKFTLVTDGPKKRPQQEKLKFERDVKKQQTHDMTPENEKPKKEPSKKKSERDDDCGVPKLEQKISSEGMQFEQNRLKSFDNCKHFDEEKKKDLAKYGLFWTGEEDIVQCKICKTNIAGWKTEEKAYKKHKKQSPNCRFINGRYTENMPLNDDPPIKLVRCRQNETIISYCPRSNHEMKDEHSRYDSFGYHFNLKTKLELAKNGFFSIGFGNFEREFAKCAFCGFEIFCVNEPIEKIHKENCPRCPFVMYSEVGNIPLKNNEKMDCNCEKDHNLKYEEMKKQLLENKIYNIPFEENDKKEFNKCLYCGFKTNYIHKCKYCPFVMKKEINSFQLPFETNLQKIEEEEETIDYYKLMLGSFYNKVNKKIAKRRKENNRLCDMIDELLNSSPSSSSASE
jgi:hypothetical protein